MNTGIFRFIDCAQEGRHATASSGEQASFRIAKALLSIAEDIQRVDKDIAIGAGYSLQLLGSEHSKTMRDQLQQATGER